MRFILLSFSFNFLVFQYIYSQDNSIFWPQKYPSKKYSVIEDSIIFKEYFMNVNLMTPKNKKKEKDLWVLRVNGDIRRYYETKDSMSIAELQYVGSVDNNGTIYVPKFPLINDFQIFVFDGLKTKQIILCKGYERRIMQGNRFAISNDSLFLYCKSDDSEFIYRYNIKLDKISKIRTIPKNLILNYYEY